MAKKNEDKKFSKSWKDMEPEAIKKALFKGGLSQEDYDRAMQVLKAKGAPIDTGRYPSPGQTAEQFQQANPDAKLPGWKKEQNQQGNKKWWKKPTDVNAMTDSAIANTDKILGKAKDYATDLQQEILPDGSFATLPTGTSQEMKDLLAKMNEYSKVAGGLTPDESAALQKLKSGTVTSAETSEALKSLKDFRDRAGDLTDLEKESLNLMRSGLAGYNAPEVQAMRESASREVERQYQGQQRQLTAQQARQGIKGGGAAFAQSQDLAAQKRGNIADIETDLVAKQADEVQKRRAQFADLASRTEAARTGRQTTAQDLYTRANATEQERLDRARSAYGTQATTTANSQAQRQIAANTLYGSTLGAEEAAQRALAQFNAGQLTNEQLAQAGLVTGAIGAYTGTQSGQQAAEIGVDQYNRLLAQQQNMLKKQLAEAEKERQNQMAMLDKQLAALG